MDSQKTSKYEIYQYHPYFDTTVVILSDQRDKCGFVGSTLSSTPSIYLAHYCEWSS